MIGLTGAHRTGKTTLAKAYAEESGTPYVTLSTSDVLARMGWECKNIATLEDRVRVQTALVEECDRVFSRPRTAFIADRTPLDVAAYLMADVGQGAIPEALETKILDLVEDCIDITNAFFGTMVLIPIALPYVPEPGKPLPNAAYQRHIQMLIQGLLADRRSDPPHWILDAGCLAIEDRVRTVAGIYNAMIENDVYVAEAVMRH